MKSGKRKKMEDIGLIVLNNEREDYIHGQSIQQGRIEGKQETIRQTLKIIDEQILADDYMSIDTKQSLKALKTKLEKLK